MLISVCTYQSGDFEVILQDGRGNEVMLSGNQKLTPEEFEVINELAPACVFTKYIREVT
jgi:hypothetical protein